MKEKRAPDIRMRTETQHSDSAFTHNCYIEHITKKASPIEWLKEAKNHLHHVNKIKVVLKKRFEDFNDLTTYLPQNLNWFTFLKKRERTMPLKKYSW